MMRRTPTVMYSRRRRAGRSPGTPAHVLNDTPGAATAGRPRRSGLRRGVVALAAAVLVVMMAPAAFAQSAAAAGKPGPGGPLGALLDRLGVGPSWHPPCGWMFLVNNTTLNIAAPDTNATYWVQPYYLAAGRQLVIDGTYPAARYFSFTTYGANGVPIGGTDLHDTQIVPQPGSVNPFTTPNPPTNPAHLRYSVRVVPSLASSTTDNTLAGLPSGQSSGLGFLVYRLYVPTIPPTGGVRLPRITTTAGPRPACRTSQQDLFNNLLRPPLPRGAVRL